MNQRHQITVISRMFTRLPDELAGDGSEVKVKYGRRTVVVNWTGVFLRFYCRHKVAF